MAEPGLLPEVPAVNKWILPLEVLQREMHFLESKIQSPDSVGIENDS